jgi:hypothetical protein
MANKDKPCGLKPVKYLNGSPWNGAVRMYYCNGSSTSAIYKGSCVAINADGADTSGKYMGCDLASAASTILGVAWGFSNQPYIAMDPTNLERDYCPASTAMYIAVVDDPNVVFEVQEDNASAYISAAAVGNTAVLAGHSGGSTTTGLSTAELDSSDVASTAIASHPLMIVGVSDRPDNTMGSSASYTKWLVTIQDHQYKTSPAGV